MSAALAAATMATVKPAAITNFIISISPLRGKYSNDSVSIPDTV
jgi:hypothetical protein